MTGGCAARRHAQLDLPRPASPRPAHNPCVAWPPEEPNPQPCPALPCTAPLHGCPRPPPHPPTHTHLGYGAQDVHQAQQLGLGHAHAKVRVGQQVVVRLPGKRGGGPERGMCNTGPGIGRAAARRAHGERDMVASNHQRTNASSAHDMSPPPPSLPLVAPPRPAPRPAPPRPRPLTWCTRSWMITGTQPCMSACDRRMPQPWP